MFPLKVVIFLLFHSQFVYVRFTGHNRDPRVSVNFVIMTPEFIAHQIDKSPTYSKKRGHWKFGAYNRFPDYINFRTVS